jgi:uncharacterized protein (DUF58 family)
MKILVSWLKKIFPYTGKGFFFFLLASVIFTAGILRADLAALFWGCSFLLLTLYAFTGNHIFTALLRNFFKKQTRPVNICFSETGITAGSTAAIHMKARLLSFFIPGFTLTLVITLQWQTRDPVYIKTQLFPGENREEIPFTLHYRGKYECTSLICCMNDLFGFTKTDYSIETEDYIDVYPGLMNREDLLLKVTGDESTDIQKKCRRNDELLEVKKYYPGDDVRKLNWKIFAHTGELFVRKGEETPPPDSRFIFILDPGETPYLAPRFSNDFMDSLVETAGSIMTLVLENGHPLFLSIPGRNGVFTFNRKQDKDLLTLLSEIWWTPEQKKIKLPSKQGMHALVFTSPGSLSLPHIIKELKTRNWNMSLFFKNYMFPSPGGQSFRIRQLFFVPDEKKEEKKRGVNDLILFKEALYRECERYKTAPWRVRDVREI